jgi:hypothetical protein
MRAFQVAELDQELVTLASMRPRGFSGIHSVRKASHWAAQQTVLATETSHESPIEAPRWHALTFAQYRAPGMV